MPFFHVKHNDLIPSDEAKFAIAREYPELPSHYYSKLLGLNHSTTVKRLAQLAYIGHLNLHKPFIDSREKISKHDSFSLKAHGYRDKKGREHRLGESIIKASTHIGANGNPDFEYIGWQEMLLLPSMPRQTLKLIDHGGDPHLIPLSEGHVHPDGAPGRLYHIPSDQNKNIIDEYDRDTEPLTTAKQRRNIEEKFKHYKEFFDKKLYTSHYGFSNCMLRVITISESRKRSLMRLYEDRYGKARHILFGNFEGDPSLARSYPPPDGRFFTMEYTRVGYPSFRLDQFFQER